MFKSIASKLMPAVTYAGKHPQLDLLRFASTVRPLGPKNKVPEFQVSFICLIPTSLQRQLKISKILQKPCEYLKTIIFLV